MFDHDCEPLLKVLLHSNSASFKQILDSFDFCLQIFQLYILFLIVMFKLVNLELDCLFFFSPHNLTIVINHASKRILFADLFDLIGQFFYLAPCLIDTSSKRFSKSIFFFEQSSILFHCFILAVAFTEHFK